MTVLESLYDNGKDDRQLKVDCRKIDRPTRSVKYFIVDTFSDHASQKILYHPSLVVSSVASAARGTLRGGCRILGATVDGVNLA